MGRSYQDRDASSYPVVAVCIDKDKNSPNAFKWAIDSLVQKGQTIVLVHVNTKGTFVGGAEDGAGFKQPTDPHMKDLFFPFRCFCTRKGIQCKDVVLDEHDVAKAIIEFAANAAIEKLVIGATARGGFRFKADIPTTISKGAPDFCAVYVINKGKVSSTRDAIRAAPRVSPLRSLIQSQQSESQPALQARLLSGVVQGSKIRELQDRIQRLEAQIQQSEDGRKTAEHTCRQLLDQAEEVATKHKEEVQKIWDLKGKVEKENAELREALSEAQVQLSRAEG